jgi:hypothetical protein
MTRDRQTLHEGQMNVQQRSDEGQTKVKHMSNEKIGWQNDKTEDDRTQDNRAQDIRMAGHRA